MPDKTINHDVLPKGYSLLWYVIRTVLGQGGFGVTYLALDTNLDRLVAIKEYMPVEFSVRDADSTVRPRTGKTGDIYQWGLQRFMAEGKTLAHFNHPNIVRVYSVFEKNNTAYMVMEYERGEDLASLFDQGAFRTESELLHIALPLLDGLSLVHAAGFIHRDIKPANIYIREDQSPVLLDFGSARQMLNQKSHAMTSLVTKGYTPFEQYNEDAGHQGPRCDIYAMAATLYVGITGEPPVDALLRGAALLQDHDDPLVPAVEAGAGRYSGEFLLAVDKALSFHAKDRPADVVTWSRMLSGGVPTQADDRTRIQPRGSRRLKDQKADQSATGQVAESATAEVSHPSRHRLPRVVKGVIGAAILLFVAVALIWLSNVRRPGEPIENDARVTTGKSEAPHPTPSPGITAQHQANQEAVEQLLTAARQALERGDVLSPASDNAMENYRAVLKMEPGNVQALRGLENVQGFLIKRIEQQLAQGKEEIARKDLALARQSGFTGHEFVLLNQRLEELKREHERQQAIADELEKAAEAYKKGQLTLPAGDNALESYRSVLRIDPDNRDARKGIDRIVRYFIRRMDEKLKRGKTASAEASLKKAESIRPGDSSVKRARQRFSQARKTWNSSTDESNADAQANNSGEPRDDMELVSRRFARFVEGLEQRDLGALQRVASLSSHRHAVVAQIFSQYRNITVSISRVTLVGAKGEASAVVTFDSLTDREGNPVIPGATWRQSKIVMHKERGRWGKIQWQ